MALAPVQILRPVVIAGFLGLMAPAWSGAQTVAKERSYLYDADLETFIRPTRPEPREGEFRRRIPKGTRSRFSSGFRDYMRDLGSEAPELDPDPLEERRRERSRYDFAFGNGEEDPFARAKETNFRLERATTRFSEKEQETRHDSYLRYLKERDPSRRAMLFREYVKAGSQDDAARDGHRTTTDDDREGSRSESSRTRLGADSRTGTDSTFDRTDRQGASGRSYYGREGSSSSSRFSTRGSTSRSLREPSGRSTTSSSRSSRFGTGRDR